MLFASQASAQFLGLSSTAYRLCATAAAKDTKDNINNALIRVGGRFAFVFLSQLGGGKEWCGVAWSG